MCVLDMCQERCRETDMCWLASFAQKGYGVVVGFVIGVCCED